MRYEELKTLLSHESLPALIIDMDALDRNIERISNKVARSHKNLRLASKSIRIPELYRYIQDKGGHTFKGILCYSVPEAVWLYEQGFRDLVVAYPSVESSDVNCAAAILRSDPDALTFMVDCPEHIHILEENFIKLQIQGPAAICIDIDVSYRPFGLHLGVQRSPLRDIDHIKSFLDTIAASKQVKLVGAMGYEAQIAGLSDQSPFSRFMNPFKKLLKWLSIRDVQNKRRKFDQELKRRGLALKFFNGGGSGSLTSTATESWLTEVTAGSGFLQSHLFDYYQGNQNEPSIFFALRVTRRPQKNIVTCQSGGFIGSGETLLEKAPLPYLPEGLLAITAEGFGEVQTPFRCEGHTIQIGAPILCRPAKAGEISEHFKEVILLRGGRISGRAKTYRGHGLTFY